MSDDWRADLHRDLAAGRRRQHASRPYDTGRWKQVRAALRGSDCVLCARFGLRVPATIADHVKPAADDHEDFYCAELQGICELCHREVKPKLEAAWRKGKLAASELNLAVSREGARLRAAAFGTGEDGFARVQWEGLSDVGSL